MQKADVAALRLLHDSVRRHIKSLAAQTKRERRAGKKASYRQHGKNGKKSGAHLAGKTAGRNTTAILEELYEREGGHDYDDDDDEER